MNFLFRRFLIQFFYFHFSFFFFLYKHSRKFVQKHIIFFRNFVLISELKFLLARVLKWNFSIISTKWIQHEWWYVQFKVESEWKFENQSKHCFALNCYAKLKITDVVRLMGSMLASEIFKRSSNTRTFWNKKKKDFFRCVLIKNKIVVTRCSNYHLKLIKNWRSR